MDFGDRMATASSALLAYPGFVRNCNLRFEFSINLATQLFKPSACKIHLYLTTCLLPGETIMV